MHALPLRFAPMLALVVIWVGTLTGSSFGEKQSPHIVKQFCATAGGVFSIEPNGRYNCVYPSTSQIWTVKQCSAGGDCEYVDYCGKRICGRTPLAGNVGSKGRPKDSKPTKLEGPTTVTAGTAGDRGGLAGAGLTTNTTLKGGTNTGAAAGIAKNDPVVSAPVAAKIGAAKPVIIPAQLSERLGRLQQQH